MNTEGHSISEALEAAKQGEHVAWRETDDEYLEAVFEKHHDVNALQWRVTHEPIVVDSKTNTQWALSGCTKGPNGDRCPLCRDCFGSRDLSDEDEEELSEIAKALRAFLREEKDEIEKRWQRMNTCVAEDCDEVCRVWRTKDDTVVAWCPGCGRLYTMPFHAGLTAYPLVPERIKNESSEWVRVWVENQPVGAKLDNTALYLEQAGIEYDERPGDGVYIPSSCFHDAQEAVKEVGHGKGIDDSKAEPPRLV